jgi:3-oxoacyl-[acyl-carrier protein] reductase
MTAIDLTGKTAIITGAGTGLGAATASALHQAGANVVINYFEDGGGVNRQAAETVVASLGDRAIAVAADVRDLGAVAVMFDRATEQFGGVDIAINNAGIVRDRTIKKMSPDEWQSVIDTNLTGAYHVCQVAAEQLRDSGRIVSLSSLSAAIGLFGQVNYAAAKAGIIGMTKVLSRELAKRAITVNAVAPGVILTEMGKTIPEQQRQKMIEYIPLGRTGEPHEVAGVILFLCSDLASYVTGQTIHVNGGWYAP